MREPLDKSMSIVLDDGSVIELDVVLTVNHSLETELAKYPVELDGERVYRTHNLPARIEIDAMIASVDLSDDDGPSDRDLVAWDRLQYVRNRGEMFTLQMADGDLDDMVIASLDRVTDADTGDALVVSIAMEQAQLGILEEVEVPAQFVSRPSGARRGAQSQQDEGVRNGENITSEELRNDFNNRFGFIFGGR